MDLGHASDVINAHNLLQSLTNSLLNNVEDMSLEKDIKELRTKVLRIADELVFLETCRIDVELQKRIVNDVLTNLIQYKGLEVVCKKA